jgi:hypothetical protein
LTGNRPDLGANSGDDVFGRRVRLVEHGAEHREPLGGDVETVVSEERLVVEHLVAGRHTARLSHLLD